MSGTVSQSGADVEGFVEGDRVVVECIQGGGHCFDCITDESIRCRDHREVGVIGLDGGYATFLITRAHYVHPVPGDLTLAQAALARALSSGS